MHNDEPPPEQYSAEYVADLRKQADQRVMMAELRSRALAAGMVDAEGLKLLDTSKASLAEDGSLILPEGFFEAARRSKPYLFAPAGNAAGSTARAPAHAPPRPHLATEMSFEEWRAARAELLRRR